MSRPLRRLSPANPFLDRVAQASRREIVIVGRNIVLCLDGTNNKYAAVNTNVVKLYAMLDKKSDQLGYYQPGIGTFAPPGIWGGLKRKIITRLDLAIAWLLEDHVSDAYRFLMRYHEEGDRIFLFGFSRGAYTARVLAAMLYKVGLLSKGNEELIPFAWDIFRKDSDLKLATGFRHTFARSVPIHFLGVWDTVSSVGWAWSPKHFQYTMNNPCVIIVRHAVALDERRTYFVQNLWGEGPDVEQVWFPGVHCDVGGGYPDGTLSTLGLAWMTREAKAHGLRTDPVAEQVTLPGAGTPAFLAQHAIGPAHESLTGWWWVGENFSKRTRSRTRKERGRPSCPPVGAGLSPTGRRLRVVFHQKHPDATAASSYLQTDESARRRHHSHLTPGEAKHVSRAAELRSARRGRSTSTQDAACTRKPVLAGSPPRRHPGGALRHDARPAVVPYAVRSPGHRKPANPGGM